jgi:hypothetical protein
MAFGMTINVYSAIGLMMLFGIVKKNSILQVDYTNTLRSEGMERHEALVAASHVRLRPILMTTIAIVAGMIPIALGKGAGAGSRASMAVTIIGGQTLCLLLTLLVTPVVYSYFDDLREWSPVAALKRRFGRERTAGPAESGRSVYCLPSLVGLFLHLFEHVVRRAQPDDGRDERDDQHSPCRRHRRRTQPAPHSMRNAAWPEPWPAVRRAAWRPGRWPREGRPTARAGWLARLREPFRARRRPESTLREQLPQNAWFS